MTSLKDILEQIDEGIAEKKHEDCEKHLIPREHMPEIVELYAAKKSAKKRPSEEIKAQKLFWKRIREVVPQSVGWNLSLATGKSVQWSVVLREKIEPITGELVYKLSEEDDTYIEEIIDKHEDKEVGNYYIWTRLESSLAKQFPDDPRVFNANWSLDRIDSHVDESQIGWYCVLHADED